MDLRDKIPSARAQAAMALRYHAREGNLKWVSLLMWAGADPRMEVPDLDSDPPDRNMGTALADALRYGREDVIRKIGIDPTRDNATALLEYCACCSEPWISKLLIDAGADPKVNEGESGPIQSLISAFGWAIEGTFTSRRPDSQLECIEIVARAGGRWRPKAGYSFRYFRTALGRSSYYSAIGWLSRMVACGAIEQPVFAELMRTPKMRELIAHERARRGSTPRIRGVRSAADRNQTKGWGM